MKNEKSKAKQTRQKIIDAMKELLKEKSADDIIIEEITLKACVARGSFYTYFKRKEDVISAIALEKYEAAKKKALKSSGDVYERIAAYMKESAAVIEKNTLQIAQQWLKSIIAPLPQDESGAEKFDNDCEAIASILNDGIEKGSLKPDLPVEQVARSMVESYYGAIAAWCVTKGKTKLTENIENYCSCFLKIVIDKYVKKVRKTAK